MNRFRQFSPFLILFFFENVPGVVLNEPGFSASADAELLKTALRSGDVQTIVSTLTLRKNGQRMDIADKFRKKFGKNLKDELDRGVDDEVRHLLVALVQLPLVFYAGELNTAMVSGRQREEVLIEILCTLSSGEMWAVSNAYKSEFQRTLIEDVEYYTSGDLRDFLTTLLKSIRDESKSTDKKSAVVDATKLYEAGVGKLGTDECKFYEIFSTRNYHQLRLVFDEYNRLTRHDIEDAILDEFSSYVKDALLTFISATKNLTSHYAILLHKGVADRHAVLTRIVVARSEIDMDLIEQEYSGLYVNKLRTDISVYIKGFYRDALLNLINLH